MPRPSSPKQAGCVGFEFASSNFGAFFMFFLFFYWAGESLSFRSGGKPFRHEESCKAVCNATPREMRNSLDSNPSTKLQSKVLGFRVQGFTV